MAFSKWVLNIGLISADGSGYVRIDDALTTLEREGCVVRRWQFKEAGLIDDEDTLVVSVSLDDSRINPIIEQVSIALDQDYIAIHEDGNRENGAWIGPRAAEWGAYDPQYFKEMTE